MTSNDLKMTSKNTNENSKEVKTKINLRGWDSNDDEAIQEKTLIEQAFLSN